MAKKLSVAFLWHMHQPLYKDLFTGKYYLPWVRLHSTYSYLDMISLVDKFPDIKVTFNLTPSLLWQIQDIVGGGGEDDVFLQLSRKEARDLTDVDKSFILKNFFSCDTKSAIFPLKKYKKLFAIRGEDLDEDKLIERSKDMKVSDFRDLQVLFNLAWCGFTLKKQDDLIKGLVKKGSDYTEEDKKLLLDKQNEVVRSIIPFYKRLQDEGRIEISTSPFYHPILPLLCKGPAKTGFDFCEDAKHQVERAVSYYEELFGKKPAGMWPSEGSVSQEIIPILEEQGIKWMATDEGILLETFKGEDILREDLIYKAFSAEHNGKNIDMVFRDIHLSNAISFKYAHMFPAKAAEDLLSDIKGIAKAREKYSGEHIVSIILDGENPWPYYPDGGEKFLSHVYKSLSDNKNSRTVTIGNYLSSVSEKKEMHKLYRGSWIDRNFNKWIGLPQKNRAWKYLDNARKELLKQDDPSGKALEELYIAEGSDWYWWYDEFGTELNYIFDKLFRLHLSNIYEEINRKPPHYLSEPIISGPSVQRLSGDYRPSEMAHAHKVLLVASEAVPYAKTGGLADVAGSLPAALASLGCDVRVIMPFYKSVNDTGFDITREASRIRHPLLEGMFGFNLYANRRNGVTTYFISNKRYFDREGLYGTARGDYSDNGMRFSFFSRAALIALKAIEFRPDIIHCNDWQSALVPFYLKYKLGDDAFYRGIKTLFTIHNMAYQGMFSRSLMRKIGIPENFFNMNELEFYGKLNFMKAGILYSDAVSTVSMKYAEEIMTSEYGAGLDGLLRSRKEAIYGIHNGVDYSLWSPRNDHFIKENYDMETLDKKKECKKDLLEYTGLAMTPDMPLLGCVTRLAHQKGMDLFANIMEKVLNLGAGVVILGRGDDKYNRMFASIAKKYPRNVYVCSDFNEELAHKIEAGCDMFIMPSRYEPCGLNQMYSIKYGTVPVVRATGGLDDVITDFNTDLESGNGFKFGPAKESALYDAIKRGIDVFGDKEEWTKLMLNGMSADFSWNHAAQQYLQLYRKITG